MLERKRVKVNATPELDPAVVRCLRKCAREVELGDINLTANMNFTKHLSRRKFMNRRKHNILP